MPADASRIATRIQPTVTVFDHDPEDAVDGHLPECRPLRVVTGEPEWVLDGVAVTDPELIARCEQKYKEQT